MNAALRKEYDLGIIGAGAWGTTLALHVSSQDIPVLLWAYEPEVVEEINHYRTNSVYLPGIPLNEKIHATSALDDFIHVRRLIVVVPSAFFSSVVSSVKQFIKPDIPIVSATKGFIGPQLQSPSSLLLSLFPGNSVGVLTGPNLAKEIAAGLPAISLIASQNEKLIEDFQSLLSTDRLRIYGSYDIVGAELGGAFKNVIAIAAGIADGLELGENSLAALITRGLAEMVKLGKILGADEKTVYGISGLGDLICTCQSPLSRNHHVGRHISKGIKLSEILRNMKAVAEGVWTTKIVYEYAEPQDIELPITSAVYHILFEDKDPSIAIRELMTRTLRME